MEINEKNIKLWSSIGPRATFGLSMLDLIKKYSDLMILTCDVLNAEKALEWGLISQIVPQENLLDTAMELAKKIVNNPPEAIRRAKRLLRLSQNINLNTALEMAASQQSLLQMTKDHKEAIQALIEKRKPEYNNS